MGLQETRAEEVTSEGTSEAPDLLAAEIANLKDVFETCKNKSEETGRFAPMADSAEDLITLADSMSFAEVSQITAQLCSLVERLDPNTSSDVDLLGLHVDALKLVAQMTHQAENPEGVAEITEELSRAANRKLNKTYLMSV